MTIKYKGDSFVGLPGKNKIDNGTCKVHQRVDPFTLVKDAYGFPADRWQVMATGTAVSAGTADQATDGPGLSGKCIKLIQASITGTGIVFWRHRIESRVAEDLKNLVASFQCLVKQSTGASVNYTLTLRKANATDNFSAVTEIANSGQISVPDATDTMLKFENVSMGDCSNGIEIEVKAEVGAITLKDLWITEMQLEEGSVATAFERVRFEDELERCMQCVRKSHPYSVAPTAANSKAVPAGTAVATNKLADCVFWEKPMRTTPTITIYDISGNAGYASHANTNVQVGTGSIVSSQASEKGFPNISESLAFTVGDLYNFNYLATCDL